MHIAMASASSRARGLRRRMCALLVLLPGLATTSQAAADWKDHNIVLVDGHWEKIEPGPLPGEPHPFPPHDRRWTRSDSSIVVLIASFRESRCPETLESMFTNAKYPERVFAGVVQQNAQIDPDCVAAYCEKLGTPLVRAAAGVAGGNGDPAPAAYTNPNGCKFYSQVRMMRMTDGQAKGPVYARALQARLVKGEDFCMQIDAHTRFIEDWDVKMLEQWGATDNEYAVLTTYPTNVHDLHTNSNNHWEMPHLCHASIAGKGKIINGRASAAANLDRPILAPLWAAGLSFSRCHAENNVPNDINLKSIFAGEEYARGARLWTHGYDFYSLSRPVIGTYYGGEKGGLGGSTWSSPDEIRASEKRLMTLLRWPGADLSPAALESLGSYGIGTRRTLEQYADWSGINTMKLTTAKNCRVKYVPWNSPESAYSEYKVNTAPVGVGEPRSNGRGLPAAGTGTDETAGIGAGVKGRGLDAADGMITSGAYAVGGAVLLAAILILCCACGCCGSAGTVLLGRHFKKRVEKYTI